jgi:hypothetical protein
MLAGGGSMSISIRIPKAFSVREENEFFAFKHLAQRLNPQLRVTQVGLGLHVNGGHTVYWGLVHLDGQRIENMEMESSFLLHFLGGLGHWAGTICTTIANRRMDTFDPHYQEAIRDATRVALLALAVVRSRHPDIRIR